VPRVVVAGAGVSGIAAALALEQAGSDVVLLEAGPEAGGALRSRTEGGFTFDDGPASILDGDGSARAFLRDLGLEGEIVTARPEARDRWVWHDGALRAIPSRPADLATTPLLSILERVRFLKEPFTAPAPPGAEETISEFIARRFGKGIARKFADALVSGIWAGDPDRLSLDACFPEVRALEQAHGSLVKGMEARSQKRRAEGKPASSGGLLSLRGGLGRVGAACRARLGSRLRTGARVAGVEYPGGRVAVAVEAAGSRERIEADALVIATSAHAAAALPGALPQAAAGLLQGIEHASLAVVQAGFRRDELPGLPPGFGFLVPRAGGLESLGWLFVSQIFDGRAPEGCVVLTGFFGGTLAPRALALDDAQLGDLAMRELAAFLGLRAAPRPELLRVVRWKNAIPQYVVGHQKRLAEARAALVRERPQAALAGNYLEGVSIPSCLASGRSAAARVTGAQESSS
jgi:protoporphyrinogen/coproporphyrinogen III oxidase